MKYKRNSKSPDFTELFSSSEEGQIVFVKSVLDSAGIPFIVRGDSHAGILLRAVSPMLSIILLLQPYVPHVYCLLAPPQNTRRRVISLH